MPNQLRRPAVVRNLAESRDARERRDNPEKWRDDHGFAINLDQPVFLAHLSGTRMRGIPGPSKVAAGGIALQTSWHNSCDKNRGESCSSPLTDTVVPPGGAGGEGLAAVVPRRPSGNMEESSSLGFKPQKQVVYNKLLPYKEHLDSEILEQIREIKENLSKALILGDIRPGCVHWVAKLSRFVKLYGICFSKEDHMKLVKLMYELAVSLNQEFWIMAKFAQMLTVLLKKKELLSPDELVLEWRPLYDLYNSLFYNSYNTIGMLMLPSMVMELSKGKLPFPTPLPKLGTTRTTTTNCVWVLRSFRLPVSYKKTHVGKGDGLSQFASSMFIVANLGGDSKTQENLNRLFKSLESYYHPSNSGPWSRHLHDFLNKLSLLFIRRLHR
ncbi:Proteasome activator complex subunit 4B [Portunus trituberculatus]|uniref:Proteasome activator complex subunit 4B n=1 Tax=Portunus trituberculatus TaxID=210409 RepID=A0A5B7EKZ3_PORTR|nr:Proteasome activator complex subunit 4B [Portunus trituberculatus]